MTPKPEVAVWCDVEWRSSAAGVRQVNAAPPPSETRALKHLHLNSASGLGLGRLMPFLLCQGQVRSSKSPKRTLLGGMSELRERGFSTLDAAARPLGPLLPG